MGLVQLQQKWVLTFQGWLLLLLCLSALLVFCVTHIHSFLAVNAPIKADALVVEGWIQDHTIEKAIAEFEQGNYQILITTGAPISKGYYLAEYNNFAELSAATLTALGFNQDKLVAVPAPEVQKDRTAAAARALSQWISAANVPIKSVNLYTEDTHARRSWLIFKQELAPDIKVGVIAIHSIDYDPKHWWAYSTGVRKIISELIAYLYARLVSWQS
ncbi:MAG: YdcF family protein [Symploca sp. SIO2E6]|nr:YdcF family protein [Symploca sp. SIO2E6]